MPGNRHNLLLPDWNLNLTNLNMVRIKTTLFEENKTPDWRLTDYG